MMPRGARSLIPRGAVLLASVLVVTGCESESEMGSATTRDDVRRLAGEVDLRIGQTEGEAPYLFGRITDVAIDTADHIYVADGQAHEVRVFGASGRHLVSAGRPGQGPGEFGFDGRPCEVTVTPENRLWATGGRRLEVFTLRGDEVEHLETISLPGRSLCRRVMRIDRSSFTIVTISSDSTGRHLLRSRINRGGEVLDSVRMPDRVAYDSLGWKEVTRTMQQAVQRFTFPPPFPASHLFRFAPNGGHAEVVTSSYRITLFDHGGGETAQISQPGPGPLLTSGERDSVRDTLVATAEWWRRFGRQPGVRSIDPYPEFEIPERKNPIRNLWFDAEGRLWVQVWTHRSREDNEAHVYTEDGALQFTATWPKGIDLTYGAIRGRTALGTTTDRLGVQRVVRVRFW